MTNDQSSQRTKVPTDTLETPEVRTDKNEEGHQQTNANDSIQDEDPINQTEHQLTAHIEEEPQSHQKIQDVINDNESSSINKDTLQAFFDANYHDYRFIDRDKADQTTFNQVKATFDKINTLLGSNDPINQKALQLAYKDLEQAVATIRTLPKRQAPLRRSNRIQERAADETNSRSYSNFQTAKTAYYSDSENDSSGLPQGTYISASNRVPPLKLPQARWRILQASDAKEMVLMSAKQLKNGYEWTVQFNRGHRKHEQMVYWFGLPEGQTPVGPVSFNTVNGDGTNISGTTGNGQSLPNMWPNLASSLKFEEASDFRQGPIKNYQFYDRPTYQINGFKQLAKADEYFNGDGGASEIAKQFGLQNFSLLNGDQPNINPGLAKLYSFVGRGDSSYTIKFKTTGATNTPLYYAAGSRAYEYGQLFNYNQLYIEPNSAYQKRIDGLNQTINRVYHLDNTKQVIENGKKVTKYILDKNISVVEDYASDPLSYVKTPSPEVLGFYDPDLNNTNAFRPGGAVQLNEFQIYQTFSESNFREHSRTGRPIKILIGFNFLDDSGNPETLVPAYLTVKPAITHNIGFFSNDDVNDLTKEQASRDAGHPVFAIYGGKVNNTVINLGAGNTSDQPLRIRLTSNENFTNNDWSITGLPSTVHIEDAKGHINNNRERNIAIVGSLTPGDYFGTIRFGQKEQPFEIRVKPLAPRIQTTAEQIRGKGGTKPNIIVSGVPSDPTALVYLVVTGPLAQDGTVNPYSVPKNYAIFGSVTPNADSNTVTFKANSTDFIYPIPNTGNLKAIVYYNKNVQSNFSNNLEILPDDTAPSVGEPVGIKDVYYIGDQVNFTVNIADESNGSGINRANAITLPSGWTARFDKNANGYSGTYTISGVIPDNQPIRSDITFTITATDNANNTSNDSQSRQITIHVGALSDAHPPVVLANNEKVLVANPAAITQTEQQSAVQALTAKNSHIQQYLRTSNPIVVTTNGNITVYYKDGSSKLLEPNSAFTYNVVRKAQYAYGNNPKEATLFMAPGQTLDVGDLKQYFTLADGTPLPKNKLVKIKPISGIPTANQLSRLPAGTYNYRLNAVNANHQDNDQLMLTIKIVDLQEPTADNRVFRISTYYVTDQEKEQIKQAFIRANQAEVELNDNDINIENVSNGNNTSIVNVTIHKGGLNKIFTSTGDNMNFMQWVDFPRDYRITWETNGNKIPGRPTDGGLEWSDAGRSLIYRYDAGLGKTFNTNEILKLLIANSPHSELRSNIRGTEKFLAEAGGNPNYKTTGYSEMPPKSDGQREYTYNGQVIQVLDLVDTVRGYGGQNVTASNLSSNRSNSTVTYVTKQPINGAPGFTIRNVIKNNTISNVNNAVYRAQLFLTPYAPDPYLRHLNSNMRDTTDTINVYIVPSDTIPPTLSLGNYSNKTVFSGETFTNTVSANDNFAIKRVEVAANSQVNGTVSNNNQQVSLVAPNVTAQTTKTVTLTAFDTSDNTTSQSFDVTLKPLKDKYRAVPTATNNNPARISNIREGAAISDADKQIIINSVSVTDNSGNRPYATSGANEIRSKEVVGNITDVLGMRVARVVITYADGSTSSVNVPVKHIIYNVVANPRYTIQGQDFPQGKGSAASDYFKLENGDPVPDATITWLPDNTPDKYNTNIGQNITVRANILFDGETTPITKESSYMVVRSVPKQVFITTRNTNFPGISNNNNAKDFAKPIRDSWPNNADGMSFSFVGNAGPNLQVVGIQTRYINVRYANGQTERLKLLAKIRPDAPRIDANSVTYKAGLTNQEVKINNVLRNSPVKLFKADGTQLTITNTDYGNNNTAIVTVSDALPDGDIKATSTMTTNSVSYMIENQQGQVEEVSGPESVESPDSASVTVTPQLHAVTDGVNVIKGDSNFDFSSASRFIDQLPQGASAVWEDNADNWKNNVGSFTKVAIVTLPNGQGTRRVDVPVKIYPIAVAKPATREVKNGQLTLGNNALNYVTFEPNTNTNGITAAWANNTQPSTNHAGVQNLTINVTYPGISTPVQVPVTLNVYQFDFAHNEYTTTVGTTFQEGIAASGYMHLQNSNGLPTDGFQYKWNRSTTGTNNSNWDAMNKPNSAQVVNATYDIVYNGRAFATSQAAKFIVKNVQPNKPTLSETTQGVITITPGANQSINTRTGNVNTYADRLVIKRNGSVITSFVRNNNTSPWTKEQTANQVNGIVGSVNNITVAAGTFNPSDVIQVIATQGNGEVRSAEQPSDDFTVVAPQPNPATAHTSDNGQLEMAPNNPAGNLVNPTTALDITYIEKIGNNPEQNKTIHIVKGNDGQWSIADKPSYVTLDTATGKVTFNANTIKPQSNVTQLAKAGSGNAESTNSRTFRSAAAHTVTIDRIIKEFGDNVTTNDINNAVHVSRKRSATIKQGTAMPTNLAGGSTTTIPVTITYNDGSTEEVTETIFTKADKRELITAKNHLDDAISTDGKTPSSINQFNAAMNQAQQQINSAKAQADQVIQNQFASPQDVTNALNQVKAAQTKIDQAKALLQNKADNSALVQAKNDLQSSIDQQPSLDGMTQQSIDNYNTKRRDAQTQITQAQQVIDNGDATAQQIADQKTNVDNALAALNQAKANLTADTSTLQQAVQQLDRTGDTTGKKPASIKSYNQAMQALNHDLTSARNNANAIINKPIRTVQEVQNALRNVNQVNDRITQAIAQLQPLADNSELKTAKAKLEAEINKTVSTDGMTQATINAYQNAKQAAQVEVNTAQQVINNGDASDQDIATEKSKVEEKYNALKQAIANLTPDLAPLQSAKTELENDINQPTSTTGMTSQSVANFNNKLNAAKQKLQAIKQVLQSNPSVATIRDNVTQANNAKTALDTARNGLTVDKAPLEAAKTQLQQSITQAEQTSTTGMTQSTASTFNDKLAAAKEKMKTITQVLKGSPTVDQINTNTSAANNAKTELDQARTNLTPDKAPLQQAKADLQVAINQAQSTDTTGMTQDSVTEFNNKLNAAKEKMKDIDRVLSSQATVAQLTESKNQATTAKNELDQARTNLTPDKAPLETAKSQLQQSINQAQNTNTTGMTQASKDALTAKLNAAKEKMTAINNVLNGSPTVADINTNVTEATNSKNALDQAIQSLVVDKAPLQNAKSALEQSISQAQQTSTAGMTQATVSTFNDKLAAARQKLQDIEQVLAGNPTVNDINSNTTATNNVKDALNQARQNLTVDKAPLETAKASLQQSINQAQQASTTGMTQASINALNNKLSAAKAKIKAIDNVLKGQPTVNDITNNTNETNTVKSELDQALQALTPDKTPLQNAKTELEQSVNQPTDTVGMTTASLNAYNQKLEAARQTLNGVNQELAGNPTVQTINDKVTQANNAKSALDQARAALELDRAPMLSALQNATSLNNAQRNAFTNQINTAPNHAALVSIQNNINELNTAMTNLRNSVADNSTIKKQIKYTDATSSNRTNYNNAVNNANQIIAEKNNPTMTASTINQKAAAVNTTKDALDGEQNLQRAKAEATAAITNASDLNQSQKNALTQQVTQAHNVQAAKVIKQNAESLNTAMTGLKQSIANHDQLIQSDNYVNADTDKKNAYTNAYNSAKAIVDGTGQNPTLTPNEVTQASQTVTQTVQDLNGTTNLNNAKQQAQTTLGQLSHLNQAQRQALETQINDAHQIATVNDVKQNATNIDKAMANLQQAIANKDEVKRSEDYVDADTNKQSAYNQAVTNAENINKQTANPTMNISDINQATTQVTTTKDALNGDEKLEKAKQRAVTTLNTLTHLNNAQKADITSNINKAPNIATVNKVSQTANDLDTAMERLQVGINDENTTLTSQNYQDATPDKKVNYTSAIQNAKAILNPNGPNKNKAQVEKALGQVKTAKDALDGQRLLEQAKQNAIQQLQQLTHLTNAQKDALTTQINGGATISDVQQQKQLQVI
ncbi:hyperosmolarity resistance protein Ebh [Staphylococcus warneri]